MNAEKRFVKYTFEEKGTNKPRENYKEKEHNTNTRTKRYVSYTEKSSLKHSVLKDMINSYIPVKKPAKQIFQICKAHPKYFNMTSKEPESLSNESLNNFLVILNKKPYESKNYQPAEHESEQDPDWDSNSDYEGGIESKKIDSELIEKITQKLGTVKLIRNTELKRHQKQFLQDHYRQKHQQELQEQENQQLQQQNNNQQHDNEKIDNDWTDYQQKQVEVFVNMGFIEKIEENQDEEGFGSDDFSVEDQKSEKESSKKSESSEDQDDVFGDEGPSTIVKKQEKQQIQNNKTKNSEVNSLHQGTVVISSHVFSRIAEQVGIPPGACIWIIKNKNQRYKVSTQFMDEMYRLNNFCESLPYISLNHSQFVHNNDVQSEKGLQTFKNYNARKHQYHHYYKNYRDNRNDVEKRKFHSKNHKSHLNKK